MLKYIIIIVVLLSGLILAVSPMLFDTTGVHPDRVFQAQWAGFILLVVGAIIGFVVITSSQKAKSD